MRDYEELKNKLLQLSVPEDIVDSYIDSAKEYWNFYEAMNRNDAHNLPYVLNDSDYDKLMSLYTKAMDKTNDVADVLRKNNTPANLVPDAFKSDNGYFTSSYRTVKAVSEKKEHIPLQLAIHREEKKVYYGSSFDGSVFGANSSRRNVIKMQGSDGKIRTGVFTPSVSFTKEQLASPETFQERNSAAMGIAPGERVDSRNGAMYDVAGLLGRSDLIARSEDITIERDGKTIKGNFMDYVPGTDLSRLTHGEDDPIKHVDPDDYHTSRLTTDAIDLSIIDYICLNVDRHSCNMIYRYDTGSDGKVRLNGLVGIDNDASFGSYVPRNGMPDNRLQSLDNTVVISEAMAEKVMNLKPAALRGTLGKYGFSKKAMSAAVERLKKVQKRIKSGATVSDLLKKDQLRDIEKAFLADPIAALKRDGLKNMMVIIPNKHIDRLNIDNIAKYTPYCLQNYPGQINCGVCNIVKAVHSRGRVKRFIIENMTHGVEKIKTATVPAVPLVQDTHGLSRNFSTLIEEEYKKLSPLTKNYAKDAKPIMSTMESMYSLTERLKKDDCVPSDNDMNLFNELSTKLQSQCREFIDTQTIKANSGKKNATLNFLIERVKKIQENTKNYGTEMRNIQEKDLLAMNISISRQADVIKRLAPETAIAKSELAQLADAETIDRAQLMSATARAIYMEALSSGMDSANIDNIELMLSQDIMETNLVKLTGKTEEYFAEMDQDEASLRNMLKDPECAKYLLNGFCQYIGLSKKHDAAAPQKDAEQVKTREERSLEVYSALGLG